MNKKGLMSSTVARWIFVVLLLVVLGGVVYFTILPMISGTGNVESVRQWVFKTKITSELLGTDYPPIPELADPIKVSSEEQLNSKGLKLDIVESLYDCGEAFYWGKEPFLSKLKAAKEGGAIFCYTCRKIDFDSSLEDYNLKGLYGYMQTHSAYPGGKPTYAEQFNRMNPALFGEPTPLEKDKISASKDKYIYFMATYNVLKPNRLLCSEQRAIASAVGGTLGSGFSATVNFLGTAGDQMQALMGTKDTKFKSVIAIADADAMAEMCSQTKFKECVLPETPPSWSYQDEPDQAIADMYT